MNVKTLCLGILHFGDATGYEIKKMSLEGRFSHFIDASFGSIYPALIRLTEEGLVSCREEQQNGRPDRKVYALTAAGRRAFLAALCTAPKPDKFKSEFLFQLLCAALLDPAYLTRLIDDRIALLTHQCQELDNTCSRCDHAGSQFVIGYGKAMYSAELAYLSANRDRAIALAGTGMARDAAE